MRVNITSVALLYVVAAASTTCAHAWSSSALDGERERSRILALFPHPGRSHQMVFEPLFRRLAERGHDVTVVSFFPVANPPPPPTYRDVSLVGLTEIYISKVDMAVFEGPDLWGFERIIGEISGMNLLASFATGICKKFLEWPTVQQLVNSNETYDVILVENFNSDCMLGFAHRYRAPYVALLSHNLMTWSSERLGLEDNPAYVPAMATPFTQEMTLLQRLENAFSLYLFKNWFKYAIQAKEQAILDKHFGHKSADIAELSRNYSLMLVNTHHSVNGVRPLVPGLVEVGGMHLERPKQTISHSVENFLNESEHGVILFSFGSLLKASTMSKSKLECFVHVFSKLPQRVLWKWEGDLANKPDNVMTLEWIPQHELLVHPKVVAFIAHGGLLGVTEAVDAGVPMLVIPFFGDQPTNGAAAQRAGIAAVLPYKYLSEQTLRAALDKILSPAMREGARQVSRVWHDRPAAPLDTAVYWVERTARLGHRQQMAAHARNLPAYQLALLDVAALAVAMLIALSLALYVALKIVLKLICRLTRGKDKTD